ncbi:helix-turn-helix domain-containing protein [Bacillus sp. AGMB 02131]|uniref:Helix-turn-helix domain-containing protein n=1 Tax=Peribacillus faecalis TaxID=2772559 RepID=A0A927HB99_9BACI|nr:helix-turn-helix domain-containing protein [Peribacillus faecalis]MBD3107183.1 helix-turn-helix domain-containing protein [Peribacillus faecalis]
MITVNYKAINQLLDRTLKEKNYKNRTQLFQILAFKMNISHQHCWRLITKREIHSIHQLNALADALGVDVNDLISIEISEDNHMPIVQIY